MGSECGKDSNLDNGQVNKENRDNNDDGLMKGKEINIEPEFHDTNYKDYREYLKKMNDIDNNKETKNVTDQIESSMNFNQSNGNITQQINNRTNMLNTNININTQQLNYLCGINNNNIDNNAILQHNLQYNTFPIVNSIQNNNNVYPKQNTFNTFQ